MAVPYSRYIFATVPWYSVLMVLGIFLAYLLGARDEERVGLPKDAMLDMVLIAVPCGIVGARLYYVLMSLPQFAANPVSVLYVWEGGIAIYGGLMGGALGVALHCRHAKRSFAALLDISAPGLALAQAIARWGNYFNREAYGPVITDVAWQFFPFGVLINHDGLWTWHVATFFYESMWNMGVFGLLWFTRKRMKRRGDVFLWYMALYGSGRFLVEQLRQDSLYLLGIRASQYVSLILCGLAAALILFRLAKQKGLDKIIAPLCLVLATLARVILPKGDAAILLSLSLLMVGGLLLLHSRFHPRWGYVWIAADTLCLLLLQGWGYSWLWRSPYFLYAGISIPLALMIPYAQLAPEPLRAPQEEA